jgi:hypothetical protein
MNKHGLCGQIFREIIHQVQIPAGKAHAKNSIFAGIKLALKPITGYTPE